MRINVDIVKDQADAQWSIALESAVEAGVRGWMS